MLKATLSAFGVFCFLTTFCQTTDPVLGGGHEHSHQLCFSKKQSKEMATRISKKFPFAEKRKGNVDPFLHFPLAYRPKDENSLDQSYYGISNYVDAAPAYPSQTSDWQCGNRTYDTQWGYNHTGVDIFTWPFPWNKMNDSEVLVVAAANGFIVDKVDGNYDRNCGTLNQNSSPPNTITLRHENGYHTLYVHLKLKAIPLPQEKCWV